MTGLVVALVAWGVFCLALLIFALGAVDDIRKALDRERALRVAAEKLLTTEQRAVVDVSVQLDIEPLDAVRHLEAALYRDMKKGLL